MALLQEHTSLLFLSNFALINEKHRKRMTIFGTRTHRPIKLKRVMTITVLCNVHCTLWEYVCIELFKIFDRNSVITLFAFFFWKINFYISKMSHFACFRSILDFLFPFPYHFCPFTFDIRLISSVFLTSPYSLYVLCPGLLQHIATIYPNILL